MSGGIAASKNGTADYPHYDYAGDLKSKGFVSATRKPPGRTLVVVLEVGMDAASVLYCAK